MEKIQELLENIYKLVADYKKQQEENPDWNIFYKIGSGVYKDELIHSYLLHSLLKTKLDGKYIFLRLFIERLNKKFGLTLNYEDFANQNKIKTEYNLGPIMQDFTRGGRIDIILNNSKGPIIIENKIFAEDQNRQIYRYYKAFQKSKIFYLTLYGNEPSKKSVYNMEKEGGKYYLLSYREDILAWLQNCQKEGINNPALKLALEQYETVVKNLTGQGDSLKMEKEIIKTASHTAENVIASFYITKNYNAVYNEFVKKHFIEPLVSFLKSKFGEGYILSAEYYQQKTDNLIRGFSIRYNSWKHIIIRFNDETVGQYRAIYGICSNILLNGKYAPKEIYDYFSVKNFPSNLPTECWPLIYEIEYISPSWNRTLEFLQNMAEDENKIVDYYKNKIEEIILIAQKAEKDGVVL